MSTNPRFKATALLATGTSFTVTADALEMIHAFGGTLHCFEGPGGCRKTGLYFSRTLPRKPVRAVLSPIGDEDPETGNAFADIELSVGQDLAARLQDAVLDFGSYNKMQRFVWLELPSAKNDRCGCRRSFGARSRQPSPCLDKQRIGLTDI